MRLKLCLTVLFILPLIAYGQSKKTYRNQTIKYSDLEKILNPPKFDTLLFEGVTFDNDRGTQKWDDSVHGDFVVSKPIQAGRVKQIDFSECNFSSGIFFSGAFEGNFGMTKCKGAGELVFQDSGIDALWVSESTFNSVFIHHSRLNNLVFKTDQERMLIQLFRTSVNNAVEITANQISMENCAFSLKEESFIDNDGMGNAWTSIVATRVDQLDSGYLHINQKDGYIQLIRSEFLGRIDLFGDGDKVTWNLIDNTFRKEVGFHTLAEIGPASYINFREIYKGRPLGWQYIDSTGNAAFYDGSGDLIANERHYRNLLRLHKRFHDFYLEGGDIQSANLLYTRIKDLETRHFSYEYDQSPSFDLWIRIGLNRLLNFYTRYGTDPARAIVISIWVIFLFAIFYLFFPSSWDLESKSKLISDIKELKIKVGRAKRLWLLSINLFVTLLNAFALSVNAFVTLGFGEIPTKGFARYVTIAEGFLGWFLLTLFSVALISQSSF